MSERIDLDAEEARILREIAALDAKPQPLANPADPWAHRSAGMKCRTCIYFVRKLGEGELGRCRRHAPRAEGGGWPAVFSTDWCGDHKLDGTKLL